MRYCVRLLSSPWATLASSTRLQLHESTYDRPMRHRREPSALTSCTLGMMQLKARPTATVAATAAGWKGSLAKAIAVRLPFFSENDASNSEVLKEVVEILFQEGLLKVLFATETFSTGLNMPARTCVFASARKFDGVSFRWLSSGEYIQMAGRAGRRGLDAKGVVILMLDSRMEPAAAKGMLRGLPDALTSAFRLQYNSLLGLLRREGGPANPESLLRRSYFQHLADAALPDLKSRAASLERQRDTCIVTTAGSPSIGEAAIGDYAALGEALRAAHVEARTVALAPARALPFLQPGRLLKVLSGENDGDAPAEGEAGEWGVLVNVTKGVAPAGEDGPRGAYILDVLIIAEPAPACAAVAGSSSQAACSWPLAVGQRGVTGGPSGPARLVPLHSGRGSPLVVALPLAAITAMSSLRLHLPTDLRAAEPRAAVARALREVVAVRFPAGLPLLDPTTDCGVDELEFVKASRRAATLRGLMSAHPLGGVDPTDRRAALESLRHKRALAAEARTMRAQAKAAATLALGDELKSRRRVLRKLGYADGDGVVSLKGRCAAEISTADELVATELIFDGSFQGLTREATTALLSCLVWADRSAAATTAGGGGGAGRPGPSTGAYGVNSGAVRLRAELDGPYQRLRAAARRVAKVGAECHLDIDVDSYVSSFCPDLMDAAYAWSKGARLAEALKLAEGVFEGSMIRTLRRLEELARQLALATRALGEADLAAQFEAAADSVKRGVVFAPSLYL